jgi:hypothetical protein
MGHFRLSKLLPILFQEGRAEKRNEEIFSREIIQWEVILSSIMIHYLRINVNRANHWICLFSVCSMVHKTAKGSLATR